jgi:hypothetical protein
VLATLVAGTAIASRRFGPSFVTAEASVDRLLEKAQHLDRKRLPAVEPPAALISYPQSENSNPSKSARRQFTIYRDELGQVVCREATPDEIKAREGADLSKLGLQQINHPEFNKSTGVQPEATNLVIILRATTQLQQNAAAAAAFNQAAQNWENVIMSPVTIYIDVDFGTTLFGQTLPPGVLGGTSAPRSSYPYQSVRSNLVAEATGEGNAAKQTIFNALPSTTVPTDLGDASAVGVSDSNARAIGLLPATAQSTDSAARIGFNSSFSFDFDPSDGISANSVDFDAVATHEIGHALGLNSDAGMNIPKPSVWDLYRFRTGTTSSTFPAAQRILTIGGSPDPLQYYFAPGNSELGLSTGGPTGSAANGGDAWQSSHWKHVSTCAGYIGIMDPAIGNGCRRTITSSDLLAIASFGYNLTNNNPPPPPPPSPTPPPNDNFANAQNLSGCAGTVTGSTFGATSEAGEPSHYPTDSSSLSPGHTIWYQWQAPASASATITTAGSDFDTILAVYTGSSLGSLTRIGFNDDVQNGVIITSSVTFDATAGTTYMIAVDGWAGDSGTVKLNWNGCPCVSTLVVNDNGDGSDSFLGDGACATTGGVCTLRAAIEEANSRSFCGPIDINFSGVTSPIVLGTSLPDVNHNININGTGPKQLTVMRSTANGTPNFRIFNILTNMTVNISGVTLSNGNPSAGAGGNIANGSGGAIRNSGNLTLTNVTVTGNRVTLSSVGAGGGIFNGNSSNLTIINSLVSGNSITPAGAQGGGGIGNFGGVLKVINSTVSGNSSATYGGGIYSANGSLTLTNVTISNNRSNSDDSGFETGGGLSTSGGNATLSNTLIFGNFQGSGATTNEFDGGGGIGGTVVSGSSYNVIGVGGSSGLSNGNNNNQVGVSNALIGPLADNGGLTMTHALLPGSPAIDAGNNALAVDQNGNPLATDQRGVGFTRILGGTVDIGAFESPGSSATPTPTPTPGPCPTTLTINDNGDAKDSFPGEGVCATAGGVCTLRAAIQEANARPSCGPIDINFNAVVSPIVLNTVLPDINHNVNLNGPGAAQLTVQRSSTPATPNFRVFTIAFGRTVAVSGMTIANGNLSGNGGGVLNNGTLTLTNCNIYGNTGISGSGIYNDGSMVLNNCNVGGTAPGQPNSGEGIRHNGGSGVMPNSGTLTINGGSITGNGSGISIMAPATLNSVSITQNLNGGGVSIAAPFGSTTLLNCLIANNTNSSNGGFGGGGVNNQSFGPVSIINTTISGNSTAGSGGGILNFNSSLTLTNVTITNNRATNTGGGVNVSGAILLRNTIVAGNFKGTGTTADDLDNTINSSSSFNLIGACNNCGLSNGTNNNQVGVTNTALGPLANNGGLTMTHALLSGSPAINTGSNLLAVDQTGIPLTTDQRGAGFTRIVNGTVDIGAFEVQSVTPSNPIDDPAFFVKQQYFDFLNRQPDQSGWDFWTNQITSCGSDAPCIEVRRINTSGAFFLSIEFQQTGNLVYKMYKAGFGNLPGKPVAVDRTPFISDTTQIQTTPGQVIVNQGNWQAQLETNKQAFALAFVQRAAFQTAHFGQDATTYVNSLFANTGASPTSAETLAAIAAFNNAGAGDAGRAAALRSVAESNSVGTKLNNEAFVLMQYFGYLQRNPYDPPEATLDYSGFNFWLAKLNQFNGDFIAAEMVKAFISSSEYRQRFGP